MYTIRIYAFGKEGKFRFSFPIYVDELDFPKVIRIGRNQAREKNKTLRPQIKFISLGLSKSEMMKV